MWLPPACHSSRTRPGTSLGTACSWTAMWVTDVVARLLDGTRRRRTVQGANEGRGQGEYPQGMPALTAWQNFYVIVGSSAGASVTGSSVLATGRGWRSIMRVSFLEPGRASAHAPAEE